MRVVINGVLREVPDEFGVRLFEQGIASLPDVSVKSDPARSKGKRAKEASANEPQRSDRG